MPAKPLVERQGVFATLWLTKKIRSVVKGLLWRVIATIDTTLLAFLFTGSIHNALSIGALELSTKTLLY